MKIPNLKKKEQILIDAFVLLVFGAVLYRVTIFPESRNLRAARSQLSIQQGLANTRAESIHHQNTLTARVEQLEKAAAEARARLFSMEEVADFPETISQAISETGNVLTFITPHDTEEISSSGEGSLMSMPMEVSIQGDYSEIIDFFQRLQEFSKLIDVNELRMAMALKPSEVNAEITLNLYVYED